MAILFHPKPGHVLICDYETGFVPPEMVKRRRVVVISPYQRNKRGLCTVVPLSTSMPEIIEDFHHRITAGTYPFFSMERDVWAKADMLATVSLTRLDRIRVGGAFLAPSINIKDLGEIRACVKRYLDFT